MNEAEIKDMQKQLWREKMLQKYGSDQAVSEEMKRRRSLVNPKNIKGRPKGEKKLPQKQSQATQTTQE